MAITPEGKTKARVDKILKKHGVWYFKPRGTVMGQSGIPDYIGCVNGRFIAVEAKAGNNQPTELQKRTLLDIALHGGKSLVVWDNEESYERLESVIKELKG